MRYGSAALAATVFVLSALAVSSVGGAAARADSLDDAAFAAAVAKGAGVTPDQARTRIAEDAAADPLIEYANTIHRDQFAGVIESQAAGEISLTVYYASGAPVDELASMAKAAGIPASFIAATFSKSELMTLVDRISADYNLASEQGTTDDLLPGASSIGIDYEQNKVVVTVANSTPELAELLAQKYGSAVVVAQGKRPALASCSATSDPWGESRYNCTPWRGGIILRPFESGAFTGANCTLTMWGRDTGLNPILLTAGHCGEYNKTMDEYHTTGSYMCTSNNYQSALYLNRDGEVRLCTVLSGSPTNLIYRDSIVGNVAIGLVPNSPTGAVGALRCIAGVGVGLFDSPPYDTDPYTCGTMLDDYGTFLEGNGRFIHGAQCDCNGSIDAGKAHPYGVSGGDSGAPIFAIINSSKKLFGIAGNLDGWYGFADYAQSALNFAFCTTSSC